MGTWRAAGPTGATEIQVIQGPNPNTYVVQHAGSSSLPQGVGTVNGSQFRVDLGAASGGAYNCNYAPDCRSVTCGIGGLQTTFQRVP